MTRTNQHKNKSTTSNKKLSLVTPNWVQTWPAESSEIFLTKCPQYYLGNFLDKCDIKVPKKNFTHILNDFGIRYAAFVKRNASYYVSRNKRNCYFVVFCLDVKDYSIISNSKIQLTSESVFVIPPNIPIDTSAQKVNALWFEIETTPYWKNILGNELIVRKSQNIKKIYTLSDLYTQELYEDNPNIDLLRSLAKAIFKFFEKEFIHEKNTNPNLVIKNLVKRISQDLSANWSLTTACKITKLKKDKLNAEFIKLTGLSLAKFVLSLRMNATIEKLKENKSLSKIAQEIGYFDSHSLSLAFKNYFGKVPSVFRKHIK